MHIVRGLARSIILHGTLLFAAQAAILCGVTAAFGMPWPRCILFVAVAVAYHGLLTGLLLARQQDFRIEPSGSALTRVNLANTLTIGRLSAIPTLLYLVLQAAAWPQSLGPVMIPLLCIVFITDFLDGIIARRRGEITFAGRYLDSTSDYLMLVALSIAFYSYALIPLWFFVLVMGRLGLFAAGMAALALREGRSNPLSTFMGKASVFALMVLYVLEIAGLLGIPWIGNELVVRIVEYAVAAVIAASIVDKALFLRRMFAASPRPLRGEARPARPRRSAPGR